LFQFLLPFIDLGHRPIKSAASLLRALDSLRGRIAVIGHPNREQFLDVLDVSILDRLSVKLHQPFIVSRRQRMMPLALCFQHEQDSHSQRNHHPRDGDACSERQILELCRHFELLAMMLGTGGITAPIGELEERIVDQPT
jgi:hypothetical protein